MMVSPIKMLIFGIENDGKERGDFVNE